MDRAHRIGQKKEVQVFRFCVENSIEEKVRGMLAGCQWGLADNSVAMLSSHLYSVLQQGN